MGRRNRWRAAAAAVCMLLVLAACGGSNTKVQKAGDGTPPPTDPVTGEPVRGDGEAGDVSRGAPDNGSNASPSANGDATGAQATPTTAVNAGKPTLPLTVSLRWSCVKAGGTQTITIKAPARSAVGYDTYYADGKSGISEGFYGGNKGKVMDDTGSWEDTWVVAAHAPPGKTRVHVQGIHADHAHNETEVLFDLVPPTGSCP